MKPTFSIAVAADAPGDAHAHQAAIDDPGLLRNQVSSTDGSITIISFAGCSIVLNWSFSSSSVNVSVQLKTPLGHVTLIDANLDAGNPSITFGGSVESFTAEGTVAFDIGALTLTASGKVCVPIFGCKSGSVSVHL